MLLPLPWVMLVVKVPHLTQNQQTLEKLVTVLESSRLLSKFLKNLAAIRLERGEEILLEYTDWGPSGSDYVGDEDEDVNVTLFTSNFGATIELDQKVYSWTDKVFVTIVAPDHNFDGNLVDEIGNSDTDPIKISTRGHDIDNYKLVETGTDTGIFTGEVILVGFEHDADGDGSTGDDSGFDKGSQPVHFC